MNTNMNKLYDDIFEEWSEYWYLNILKLMPTMNPWCTYHLSKNSNISINLIKKYSNDSKYSCLWESEQVSCNKSITWKNICEHPDYPWDWYYVSLNENITWKIICEHPNNKWEYGNIGMNPNIKLKDIEDNIDKDWNWITVSWNPHLTLEFLLNHYDKDWDWMSISINQNIIDNIIEIGNDGITILHKFREKIMLSWYHISQSKKITWEFITSHVGSQYDWDWKGIAHNPNINFDIINANLDYPWEWDELSNHKDLTIDIINMHLDKPWNWEVISSHKNITWEIIKSNPHIKWNYNFFSINPNITFEIIESNPTIFNKCGTSILNNSFEINKDMFIRNKLRKWFRKSNLKEELIAKLWHPKNFEKFKYYDPEMFSEE